MLQNEMDHKQPPCSVHAYQFLQEAIVSLFCNMIRISNIQISIRVLISFYPRVNTLKFHMQKSNTFILPEHK